MMSLLGTREGEASLVQGEKGWGRAGWLDDGWMMDGWMGGWMDWVSPSRRGITVVAGSYLTADASSRKINTRWSTPQSGGVVVVVNQFMNCSFRRWQMRGARAGG